MPTPTVISNRPRNKIKSVIRSSTIALSGFAANKARASLALEQKFFPYIATIMYALRLINLRNFSKHKKQHLQQQLINVMMPLKMQAVCWVRFAAALILLSMICIRVRMSLQMAMSKAPNAIEPK